MRRHLGGALGALAVGLGLVGALDVDVGRVGEPVGEPVTEPEPEPEPVPAPETAGTGDATKSTQSKATLRKRLIGTAVGASWHRTTPAAGVQACRAAADCAVQRGWA